MIRRLLVTLHRYLGLGMLVLLLVISITGSILVFGHEIDARLNPSLLRVPNSEDVLGADELTRRIEQFDQRLRVSLMPLSAAPGRAYEVRVTPRPNAATGQLHDLGFDRVYVDPANGQILGMRQWGAVKFDTVHFIPLMDVLHRRLQLPGKWGVWLTGGLAILWLLASLIGGVLTLPRLTVWRQSFWAKWKSAWGIKRGASSSRLTFDLHRSLGLWSLPFTLVIGTSGVYFSLADEVFKPIVNLFSTVHQHPVRSLAVVASAGRVTAFGLDEAVKRSHAHLEPATAHYRPWYINHLVRQGVYRVAFKEPDMFERALSLRYEQVYLDDQTGELRAVYGYHKATNGERFVVWQYPLHTGRVLGIGGRIAVLLTGLAVCVMSVTGLMVWFSRWAARRKGVKILKRKAPSF